jgi:hypothetical protein
MEGTVGPLLVEARVFDDPVLKAKAQLQENRAKPRRNNQNVLREYTPDALADTGRASLPPRFSTRAPKRALIAMRWKIPLRVASARLCRARRQSFSNFLTVPGQQPDDLADAADFFGSNSNTGR